MKLRLISGGIAAALTILSWPVAAQTATPPATSQSLEQKPASVARPVETRTKPGSDLEFKPAAEKDPLPAPAPPPAASPATAPQRTGPKVIEDPGPETPPRVAPAPSRAQPLKQGKPYIIGPLDVLEVSVWNDQKLSGMRDVATDGTISMPLIGPIMANGLTVGELTAVVKEKLTALIIEPEVYVQVIRYNSKKYSIMGGCARNGDYPLIGDVTILDAFANCGGFKEFANAKKIYILRGTKQLKFNYRDVIKGKHMEQNILLENGDRIVIPE